MENYGLRRRAIAAKEDRMSPPSITGKKALPADLPPSLHDDQVLNFKQAAAFRGVSLATLRRQDAAGKLPTIQLSERRKGLRVRDLKALRIA
jgi:hypothetical protein